MSLGSVGHWEKEMYIYVLKQTTMTRTFLMILCNTNYDWLLQSRVEVKGISRLGQFWTRFFYLLHFTSSRPILYILILHYLVWMCTRKF